MAGASLGSGQEVAVNGSQFIATLLIAAEGYEGYICTLYNWSETVKVASTAASTGSINLELAPTRNINCLH